MAEPADSLRARFDQELRPFGPRFDAEVLGATRDFYRPHLDLTPSGPESADVPYGPHARHRLDVYRPATACRGVVVFVHGGGFVAGDKNGDGVYYRNIGRWLAREGLLAVLPNYRLAPADGWPAGTVDVAAVLAWALETLTELKGGALPLFVLGQSAGASHVASWLFDDAARGCVRADVAGVMLMSGFYAPSDPLAAGPRAYFGEDPALYAQRSSFSHVKRTDVPLCLSLAELDPGWIVEHTYALARAITLASGKSPDFHFFRGHNHTSTVQCLGTPQSDTAVEILRFVNLAGR